MEINPLSDVSLGNIFSHSAFSFYWWFSLLWKYFLVWCNSIYYFFFCSPCLSRYIRKHIAKTCQRFYCLWFLLEVLWFWVLLLWKTVWRILEHKWNLTICDNMDGLRVYGLKWNKSVREKQITIWFHWHVESKEQNKQMSKTESKSQTQSTDWWLPEGRGLGDWVKKVMN